MPPRPHVHRPLALTRSIQQQRRRAEQVRSQQPHRQALCRKRYRTFRRWLLAQRPVCEDCRRESSLDIHHVRGLAEHPEDLCDQDQCRALCHSCHSKRTARGE